MFYVYLMHTTKGFIKIGQTAQTVEKRRRDIMRDAKKHPTAYNDGDYRILASIACDGDDIVARNIESSTQERMRTIHADTLIAWEGSHDYQKILQDVDDITLIDWFTEAVKVAKFLRMFLLQG